MARPPRADILRLRAPLKRHVNGATQPAHQLEQRRRLGRHDAPRDHAPGVVTDDSHPSLLDAHRVRHGRSRP